MAGTSDYAEEVVLKSLLNGVAWPTYPYTPRLGIAITTPFSDSSYASEMTIGTHGYNRKEMGPLLVGDSGGGTWIAFNPEPIQWGNRATTADWGPIVGWGIFDNYTGGNLLVHGTCPSVTVLKGEWLVIAPFGLIVEMQ